MRKRDPKKVRNEFQDEVDRLAAYFRRLAVPIRGSDHAKGDLSRLAQSTFLTAFVEFERFVSDLFLAYLNRDFSAYQRDLEQRIVSSVTDSFNQWAGSRVSLDKKRHVRAKKIENILDPDGWNLTFSTASEMKNKANAWLIAQHRKRVCSISAHDERLIDTARAMRHFIAHGSRASKQKMNEALSTVDNGPPNTGVGRGVNKINNVGAFLKFRGGGEQRVLRYLTRLRTIAGKM